MHSGSQGHYGLLSLRLRFLCIDLSDPMASLIHGHFSLTMTGIRVAVISLAVWLDDWVTFQSPGH